MSSLKGEKNRRNDDNVKYALVKWIGGRDDGQLDVLDLTWLKNFDIAKWKSTPVEDRETEVAEWRVGKQTQAGTWLAYDCSVLSLGQQKDLKKEKATIEAEGKKPKENNSNQESVKAGRSKDDDSVQVRYTGKDSDVKSRGSTSTKLPSGTDDDSSGNSEGEDDVVKPLHKDSHKRSSREADGNTLSRLQKQNKKLKLLLAEETLANKATKSNSTETAPKIAIHTDSPYLVDPLLYKHSKAQGCSSFVGAMLRELFSTSVLVVSNIRGGKSKVNKNDPLRRWALDRKKRVAITVATTTEFPGTKTAAVNKYITNHINSLRFRLKGKNMLEKYEEQGRKKMALVKFTLSDEEKDSEGSDGGK